MQDNIDGNTKSLTKFADGDQFDYKYESLGKYKIRSIVFSIYAKKESLKKMCIMGIQLF